MHWMLKAKIQKACAAVPQGDRLYRQIQLRFGSLNSDPFRRLPQHSSLVRQLAELDFDLKGSRCLEVGTGHLPIAPVAFYLAGASEVVTVDLHRRLVWNLTREMLHRLAASEKQIVELYDGLLEPPELRDRLAVVGALADRPKELFEKVGIHYVAPGDAALMADNDASYDLHFSITVLEHIGPTALRQILAEAHRLLRPNGIAAHLVDLSDHFAHQDASISSINFLRFSQREWQRIGGNEFSYCNRLRASELESMFVDAGFAVELCKRTIDSRSVAELKNGFPLHSGFTTFDIGDLSTTSVHIYARPDDS